MIGKVYIKDNNEPQPEEPTPGPWYTVEPGHGHPTQYLCVQFGDDDTYTTLELKPADAKLACAAQDMKATLEYLRDWGRQSGHIQEGSVLAERIDRDLEIARLGRPFPKSEAGE